MASNQLTESDMNNSKIKPDMNKSKIKPEITNYVPKIIRMCVFGATGVGKSTLCNFICNQNAFQAADGPNSCTKEPKTCSFDYNINGKVIKFKITDTPGWFDMNLCARDKNCSRFLSPYIMIQKINECIKIAKNGVTAFFIVVPYERLHMDIEQSIHFMRDCFDSHQLEHVYMIFTKCKRRNIMQILDLFKQQKQQGEKAAALLYNYSQTINEQCFATECEYGDEKELITKREKILTEMYNVHEKCGVAPESIFQRAQKNYQQQLKVIEKKQRKKMLLYGFGTTVLGSCVAFKAYMKYKQIVSNYSSLQNDYLSLENNHSSLKTLLQTNHSSLKNNYSSLKSDYREYEVATGVAEVAVGVLGFIFEPFTSTVAITDGTRRLFKSDE